MLDLRGQADQIGIDCVALKKIYSIFLDTAAVELKELKKAMNSGDSRKICRLAHHLKGSAKGLDIIDVGEISGYIEDHAAQITYDELTDKILEMENVCQTLKTELEEYYGL